MVNLCSFLDQPSAGRVLGLNGNLLDLPSRELGLNSDDSLALLVISWFAVHPDISFAKIRTLALSES